jgi:capsular polysaccharide biosynthesis protein
MENTKQEKRAPASREAGVAPAGTDLFTAIRWHPWVATLPVLLLLGAGIALGVMRTPLYTADARLAVRIDTSEPAAVINASETSSALATTFSRTATASAVIEPVAAELRMSEPAVGNAIVGTPVPSSSIFQIEAEAESANRAVELANSISDSLVDYASSDESPAPAVSLLILNRALGASNDQSSTIAIYGFVGLLAGLTVALALVLFRFSGTRRLIDGHL